MSLQDWTAALQNKKIIIWGASIGGDQAYHCLAENGLSVEAYCDNDEKKQMALYNGKKVISPATLREMLDSHINYIIIIASFAFEKIYEQIRRSGITCEVFIYLLYDPCHLKSGNVIYSDSEKKAIMELYDAESYTRRLLYFILERGFLNFNGFDSINPYIGFGGIDAYYYDNIAGKALQQIGGGVTLLDVGSYIGDSAIQIQKVFADKIKRIYAFEPSQDNWTQILDKNIKNLTLYKTALGSEDCHEFFSESGPFFRISGSGNGVLTEVSRLDSLNIDVEADCIMKIDIEGSEMDCLNGSANFIRTHKPYMAVCVYHRERDVLEIPRYLRELVPEYQFLLRGGMHTVCYAFPKGENDKRKQE